MKQPITLDELMTMRFEDEPWVVKLSNHAVERWPDWLAVARVTDDAEGDFVADMRRDPNAPRSFANVDALRAYLRSQEACQGALATVPFVWRRFQNWARRHA